MIISHKNKFIFTKPRKVAGTSVEVALSDFCGPEDVITENVSSGEIDEDRFDDYARNSQGFFNHMRPARIRQKVGNRVWDEYFVFSIVRNPWDMVVSRYFWNKKNATPRKSPAEVLSEIRSDPGNLDLYGKLFNAARRSVSSRELGPDGDFEVFVKEKLPLNISNTKYYFDWRGRPFNDFVIKYENLDEDYKKACEEIGLECAPLPSLKTKTRKKGDYREMYDDELRNIVARKFKREIDFFGYEF